MASSAILPLNQIVTEQKNVEVLEEDNDYNKYKKDAMYYIDNALLQLGSTLLFSHANGKLVYLQRAYPSVSKAFDALNNVEHTPEIVEAKSRLLDAANKIDQAARLGNVDAMNMLIGEAIISLSIAQRNIPYQESGYYKREAMYYCDQALLQLGQTLFYNTANGKLIHLQTAYPYVSKAFEALNNVEHTPEILEAKYSLLEAADKIDQAARLGNPDAMNMVIGGAIRSLSLAQMNIGFSVL
ncbi:hypothetical protein [Spiroplasma monobiae]|uniref:Uncharacterized protein n=1 Tax=Spiroplasma monobiae MQ-1 TaxID=1336748 RepID=A0A2K9LU77_SPISQ|nr:hypothetical protein [Spiroplasma monobiae]AUM62619.1 hypothetical protein SMONO_v1c03700 [Spiroplasma monobiae MQ-1]